VPAGIANVNHDTRELREHVPLLSAVVDVNSQPQPQCPQSPVPGEMPKDVGRRNRPAAKKLGQSSDSDRTT